VTSDVRSGGDRWVGHAEDVTLRIPDDEAESDRLLLEGSGRRLTRGERDPGGAREADVDDAARNRLSVGERYVCAGRLPALRGAGGEPDLPGGTSSTGSGPRRSRRR